MSACLMHEGKAFDGHRYALSTLPSFLPLKVGLPKYGHNLAPHLLIPQMHDNSCWEVLSLEEALPCLEQAAAEPPSLENFIYLLQQCRKRKTLGYARIVHAHIHGNGLHGHHVLGNHLVPVFVECSKVSDAHQVFQKLAYRNEYSWTSLIQGYVEAGEMQHAFNLFKGMQEDCIHPSMYTLQALLKACARLKCMVRGQELHVEIAKEGFERDPFVASTLVDFYAKCGAIAEAREVFDELRIQNIVSWNALIAGYAEHGYSEKVMDCLKKMRLKGLSPNAITYVCSLKGCGTLGAIERGQAIHTEIVKEEYERDPFVGGALLDFYAKCDSLAEAQEVFDELPIHNVVSWTALISGYSEHGLGEEALNCLQQMQLHGVSPSIITLVCSLKACGTIGAIDKGREMHDQIVKEGFARDILVGSTLLDMYAKCGLIAEAQEVFNELPAQDIVSWSVLIAGYARLGLSDMVFLLFERMREACIAPDGVTFLSVLTACSHAGFVEKGQFFFDIMSTEHGIIPTIEHRTCMIDLLGRAGQLDAAVTLLEKMPFQPSFVTWTTLLDACRKWGNVQLAKQVFDCAIRLDEKEAGAFVLLSSMYAEGGYEA